MNAEALAGLTGTSIEQAERRIERYQNTFETMKPWLPDACEYFLDIGCGVGGVPVYVARHYPNAHAHLLDGDAPLEKWTSYREDGRAWADVGAAVRVFHKHLPDRAVTGWSANRPLVPVPQCELVYSNVSWGHHYPIETYLELARRVLKPGGRLIVDLRQGPVGEHGRTVLERHFRLDGLVHVGGKYERLAWSNG